MKRAALVILFTLCMTSLANAQFIPMTFTMSAPATAKPNELITVTTTVSGITTSEKVTTVFDMMVVISGTSSYTEGKLTPCPPDVICLLEIFPPWNDITLPTDAGNGDTIITFTVTGTSVGTLDFDLGDAPGQYMGATTDLGNYSYLSLGTPYGPLTVVGASTQVVPDLDDDAKVNLVDFAILASQWRQEPGIPSADIAPPGGDGKVDEKDLAVLVLAETWLWEEQQ